MRWTALWPGITERFHPSCVDSAANRSKNWSPVESMNLKPRGSRTRSLALWVSSATRSLAAATVEMSGSTVEPCANLSRLGRGHDGAQRWTGACPALPALPCWLLARSPPARNAPRTGGGSRQGPEGGGSPTLGALAGGDWRRRYAGWER